MSLNAQHILEELIRFDSITPDQTNAQNYITELIAPYGFKTTNINHTNIQNIYCEFDSGKTGPHLSFAGHTDIVPAGDLDKWQSNPFAPTLKDHHLYGRGACDMKSGLAAFLAAGCNISKTLKTGKISFLITGDEEGEGKFGTLKILDFLKAKQIKIDECLIAEPTSSEKFGDTVKIGRRGSLHGHLIVYGKQGHAAYPEKALNPHLALIKILDHLQHFEFDQGFEVFPPSNLEVLNIMTNNPISNIIPASTSATFNVRFNPSYTAQTLIQKLHDLITPFTKEYKLETSCNAEAFLSKPGKLVHILKNEINKHCYITPEINASGGSSDARFIQTICSVVEFGPLNKTAHHIDENVSLRDLKTLQIIFEQTIRAYFSL